MIDGNSCSLPENEMVAGCMTIPENIFMIVLYGTLLFVFFVVPVLLLLDTFRYKYPKKKEASCTTGSTS